MDNETKKRVRDTDYEEFLEFQKFKKLRRAEPRKPHVIHVVPFPKLHKFKFQNDYL